MSDQGDPTSTPPGWYPDPWKTALHRWWDGREWTGHVTGASDLPGADAVPLVIPESQFWTDAKTATTTCLHSPRLLVATLAIQVIPAALSSLGNSLGALNLLGGLIGLATIGFYGTQRVWLLRLYRGESLSAGEVYELTKGYFGRFFGLGVRLFLPFGLPVGIVAVATRNNLITLVVSAVVGFLLDVLLTFVVPDLTFKAASPKHAWEMGRALLRQSWPRSRWYVLAPGIALLTVSNTLAGFNNYTAAIAVPEAALSALLSLIFRGTILAYYLRLRPDIDDRTRPG